MTDTLLTAVDRYTAAHADKAGLARTPAPGLTTIRSTAPSGLVHAISRPIVCLVLQGRKQVTMGRETLAFGAGDSLLITADVPTVSQITHASVAKPYLSLVVDLDPAAVADLTVQMEAVPVADDPTIWIEPTDAEIADAARRLMRLLERPGALPVLHAQLTRELHYWLLTGRHGAAIRRLGLPDSHLARVARAGGGAKRVRAAVAGRATGGRGRDESVVVLSPLPGGDLALATAVSEAVASDRGAPVDPFGRRIGEQHGLCGGLRKRASVHAGLRSDVRLAARQGQGEVGVHCWR